MSYSALCCAIRRCCYCKLPFWISEYHHLMASYSDNYRVRSFGNEFESNMLSIEEVEERIRRLLLENTDLRNTLQQNNTYMRQLSVSLIEWQDEVARVQKSYCSRFEKARELVGKLRSENEELKKKIKCPSPQGATYSLPVMNGTIDSSHSISQEMFGLSLGADAANPNSLESFFLIEEPKQEKEAQYQSMESEIDSLRQRLALEMENNHKKQLIINQTQAQYEQLMDEYNKKVLKEEGEKALDHENRNGEIEKLKLLNENLRLKSNELEEQVKSAHMRLAKAEELSISKGQRNNELEIRISQLEKQLETLPILKTQIELYQTDFEAERSARESLAGEKDALAQEIRTLKRQLESRRPSNAEVAGDGATAVIFEEETLTAFTCPKCNLVYNTMDSLNNHLDICLNQQMYP